MTKKLKKTTAFLSAVAMVMAMLLYFPSGMFSNIDWGLKASAEAGTQTTNGNWINSAEAFTGGTGTDGDPYKIATAEQLAYLAQQVNAGNYSGKYFKLTADIDLGGKEWTPIGTDKNRAFKGNFSGDGHKIKNLTINKPGDGFIGLFGCNGGTIMNVGIEGGSVTGKGRVGGVCGYNNGGTISNCYNTASVTGVENVGGVCGENYGTIENCYNTGKVTGTGSYVGGVCGFNYAYNGTATITNCYNTGDVSGSRNVSGVCGWNKAQNGTAKITNCYNTGKVTGGYTVGGVCGENYAVDNGTATIENCYNTGKVTGTGSYVGGVCGLNDANTSNCYYLNGTANKGIGSGSGSADPKTLNELCASLPNNFDTNIWTAGSAPTEITTIAEGSRFGKKVYTLPSLNGVGTAQTISVDVYNFGTTNSPDWQEYTPITDAAGLQAINDNLSGNYVLMNDIDLSTVDNFTPIGTDYNNAFTGKFSGNGHKITNLTINSESNNVGLFGYSNGTIMNVGIEGGSVTGKNYVGGVCGYNEGGTITNCYNTGSVTGTGFSVGGVCGYNEGGTITNCYNTGSVTGNNSVGGVCGYNGIKIENCYNTGSVTGYSLVGGVCGDNYVTIANCYYLEGTSSTGIGSGSDTAESKTLDELCASLPNNFDTNIWKVGSAPTEITTIAEGSRFGKKVYTLPSLNGVGTAQTISVDVYNFGTTETVDWQEYISIRTAEELQAIGNDSTSLGKNYVLMEDIDLEEITDFTPIGTDENNAFTGKFSGNGHKITNLTINKPDEDYIGLFGYSNGTIMNVGIEGGSVTGKVYVGGVCGENSGTISNCYNTGKVTGTGSLVGGVCGYNYSTGKISYCYNTGAVSGNSYVGGVCGNNKSGTISNCYFDSKVYNGNAVGNNNGTVSGNVLGKTTKQFTRGEVAYLLQSGQTAVNGTIPEVWGQEIGKDLYPVLGGKKVYLTTGECEYYTNIYYEEEQSHSYKNGICDNCGGYLPAALTNDKYDIDGDGIKDAVYEISNASQLYWFADKVYYDNGNFGSANAVLTADITVNTGNVAGCNGTKAEGWRDWTPIGNNDNQYTGTFDGQKHTISGLYFNDTGTDYVGLFGYSGGTIKNVGVVDSYFKGKGRVGGVCGFNDAYNYNSTATITNCYNTGYVSGNNSVGGVCGYNFTGEITNCYNTGAVNGTGDYVGGVCGFTTGGTIANCYFDSKVYNGNAVGYNYSTPSENILGKETTQFTSGEVAYLLSQGCTVDSTQYKGDVWGQDLSVKNSYPVLGGKKVLANSDQSAFANDIIIYGQSATLDGMIGMNIYVAADDNYEWSASFNGNPVEKPAKDENGLYKFTYQVAAKDMDNKIQFTVGDKIDVTVSVSDYLADLSKTDNESLKNLADSMSVYGDAAKAYFSGGSVADETVTDDLSVYDFTVGTMPDGISYYGSSLILESETTIRHYFTIAEGYDIANFDFGSEASLTESEKNPGYYFIDIKNISAEKLGNAYTVSINSEDVITGYSVLSYAKKVLDSEETDANLKNLVKALYIYNQNAIAYNAA